MLGHPPKAQRHAINTNMPKSISKDNVTSSIHKNTLSFKKLLACSSVATYLHTLIGVHHKFIPFKLYHYSEMS